MELSTKDGIPFAVLLPKKWKRKPPLPLVVHIPLAREMPAEHLRSGYMPKQVEELNATKGAMAIHCALLLQAHNKEDAEQKRRIDIRRLLEWLGRDCARIEAVIATLEENLPIRKDRVILAGKLFPAEVALGIAVRMPKRFAALHLTNIRSATATLPPAKPEWDVLVPKKELAPVLGMPILVAYDSREPEGPVRAGHHRGFRTILVEHGFKNVTLVDAGRDNSWKGLDPATWRRLFEILVEERKREGLREARDALLTEARRACERDLLSKALRHYREALKFEQKHGLDAGGAAVYALLEKKGRAMLAAAEGLSAAKRKEVRRRVARLFKGLALAGELR